MEERPNLSNFLDNLKQINAFDRGRLVSRTEWGAANFEEYKSFFDNIFQFVDVMNDLDISLIPETEITNTIISAQTNIHQLLSDIDGYNVQEHNHQEYCTKCRSLNTYIVVLTKFEATWAPFLLYKKGDIEQKLNDIDIVKVEANSILKSIKETANKNKEESKAILDAMREASASAGVATFNADFDEAAKERQPAINFWGRWLLGLSCVTIIVALWSAYYAFNRIAEVNSATISFMVSKLVVIAILLSATLWCGKMYKAEKHQQAINRYKANALRTFQAFIKATDDEQTRNAVLLETTRAIFGNYNTGYLVNNQQNDAPIKILETIKSFSVNKQ